MSTKLIYNDLLGVKFKRGGQSIEDGFDCYNLCREIYKRIGLELRELPILIKKEVIDFYIKEEPKIQQFEKINNPDEHALITFKIYPPFVTHVGVILKIPYFIHILKKSHVTVERFDIDPWARKIGGFYKWNPLV